MSRELFRATERRDKNEEKQATGDSGRYFQESALVWLSFVVEVQVHDNEQEQDHDGPCVNDDVDDGNEFGTHQQVHPGDAEEYYNKIEYAMYRVFRYNDHNRSHDGQE